MRTTKPETRPVNLDLLRIRQPVTAITSIAHRISGVLLFLSIPLVIYLLERSLQGQSGYREVLALFDKAPMKLLTILIAWAAAHHFFAGIRFLLLDIELGVDLPGARKSAFVVNVLGVVAVLIAMAMII
jgi:succinate dehydrogenase / fumarate reductase cytochrome b subunit